VPGVLRAATFFSHSVTLSILEASSDSRTISKGRTSGAEIFWKTTTRLAFSALVVLGCEQVEPSSEASTVDPPVVGGPANPVAIGAVAVAEDYEMSVEGVRDCALPPPFEARKGHKKVAVEVVIEGKSAREVPVNPFYASVESAEGAFEATLAGCKPMLRPERVTRGKKARGIITFEVPNSARRLRLTYAPTIIGSGREDLRFDLGR
jgi:hypothetical protein